jgi:PST family polysaccharide transporter
MGEVWAASSTLFGLQALASSVVVVFGHVASEGYRAMGKPRVSLLVQLFVLGYTIPVYIVGAKAGYEVLSVIVPMARLIGVFVQLVACWMVLRLSPLRMFGNVAPFYVASLLCGTACMSIALLFTPGTIGQCALMAAFATTYAALSLMVPPLRKTLCEALTRLGLLRILPKWMVEYFARGL